MEKRAHVTILGDVIGVGFRFWVVANAKELNLTGWVRNTPDGCVEAVFEGPEEKVNEMVRHCHDGPEVAWVEEVKVEWEEAAGEFDEFDIRK